MLFVDRNNTEAAKTSEKLKERYYVNDTAIEIISLIDGNKTLSDIINILAKKYDEDTESIQSKVEKFLGSIKENYNVTVGFSDKPIDKPVKIRKVDNIYPVVASIELTYKCNLRCLHCYGEYGTNDISEMKLEDAKKLLLDLKDIGVQILEFTGGDVSLYPHLKELLEIALSLDYKFISILTNSVVMKDEIFDLVIANANKFVMQIDLHSLDDEYLKWFTKASNTVEIIKSNIKKMVDNGVVIRVATIATKKNVDELEKIADWLHDNGVINSAMGPVISLCRAKNNDVLLDDIESIKKFNDAIERINSKYKNFVSMIEDTKPFRANCGSLTSNVTITPNGDIKHCTMDNLEYVNSSIGNVFKDGSIKQIYDKNREYIDAIFSTKPPKLNLPECKECMHKYFCANCLLRGFIKHKEIGDECKWYQNLVPQIVKNKLSI